MKRLLVLVSFLVVLLGFCVCARAELGMNLEINGAYYGEWSKEGDTYFCKGPKQFDYYREGWLEDGSLCITSDGTFSLYISGAEEGKKYRTALFVPRSDGTYASICNVMSGPIVSLGISEWNPVLLEPGLYEGFVAVVTSEDGEVFEHTFDVLCAPDVNKKGTEYSVTPEKKFFDTEQEDARYLWDNYLSGPLGRSRTLPKKGVSFMFTDRKNVVFSGLDGMDTLYLEFGLNKKANLKGGLHYTVTLTELATGKSFSTTGGRSWDDIQRDWQRIEEYFSRDYIDLNKYSFPFEFELPPDWQEGEYELKIEVDNVGEDALRIQLKKDFNPIPIYQKYCPDLPMHKSSNDNTEEDYEEGWNWDSSVYYSEQGFLHLELYGVKPGKDYYALFQYTTPDGQTFTQYRQMKTNGNVCSENFLISTVAGTYEDIQLTVAGGGEIVLSRTFDMVVKTGVDTAPRGLVFGLDEEVKAWVFMGDDTLSMEDYQTESGFFVPYPRPGVYQVTLAEFYSIYVHLAFNGESEENLIIALIKAEDGKPLEECERWWISGTIYPPHEDMFVDERWPGIEKVYQKHEGINFYGLPGNIPAGDYQLVVQLGDKAEIIDITLQIIDEEMVREEIRKAEEK